MACGCNSVHTLLDHFEFRGTLSDFYTSIQVPYHVHDHVNVMKSTVRSQPELCCRWEGKLTWLQLAMPVLGRLVLSRQCNDCSYIPSRYCELRYYTAAAKNKFGLPERRNSVSGQTPYAKLPTGMTSPPRKIKSLLICDSLAIDMANNRRPNCAGFEPAMR